MASVSPQTFFRFAADHHLLLVALYAQRDGITESGLMRLIRTHAAEGGPPTSYTVDRLRELGFIDYAPHATAQYEMTRPFAELMSSLLREYRLTSVEVIRSYFTAMDAMAVEIHKAMADLNGDLLVRALGDLSEHVERMRHDSRRNREGVIATTMKVKSNRDRTPPKRRYAIINRLWSRYLVPLRDMIDTEKAMDAALDRMEGVLAEAAAAFLADGAVAPMVEMGRARLRRMRRDVVLDFRESIREISPLYEELRRENALARGASHALDRINRQGLPALALPARLGVGNWQQRGLFSDGALEAYLLNLRGYVPARPPPLGRAQERSASVHIRLDTFDEEVQRALPLGDALAWLQEAYPDIPLGTRLRLYGRLHSGRYAPPRFAQTLRHYALADAVLTAYPMRLEEQREEPAT